MEKFLTGTFSEHFENDVLYKMSKLSNTILETALLWHPRLCLSLLLKFNWKIYPGTPKMNISRLHLNTGT